MKISFICTVYNEEATIDEFLLSLSKQTKLPDEIIITDAGSQDETISKLKKYQKKSKVPVKILLKHGNRSTGRNQAIKHASGDIIACSDAGCILDQNWIKNITAQFFEKRGSMSVLRKQESSRHKQITPLKRKENYQNQIDVVSGYYLPKTDNIFQKSLAAYTCVMPDRVDKNNFLPSSRSIAFKKSAWQQVDGYPEELDTCEDLIFATKLKKAGLTFIFAQNAIVYWPQRKNILQAFKQFFSYAVGDGRALFIRSQVPFIFLRYLLGIALFTVAVILKSQIIAVLIGVGLLLYISWAIKKNYKYVKNIQAFFYLPLLQFTADAAVLLGTSFGLLTRKHKNYLTAITFVLFCVMMFMLFIRSGIFTIRLINEVKTATNIKSKFMPSIKPCKPISRHLNAEEQHILNYRALGAKCKK